MPPEFVDLGAGDDVPDLDDLRARDRQMTAVGVEGQVVDPAPRAGERGRLPAGRTS